jgi:hypothetical protein
MTPFPLLLLLWGIATWFGLLPNRIVVYRLNPTPFWAYTRRVLGLVASAAGGLWLALDIWMPNRMTDPAGWAIVATAAIGAAGFIARTWQGASRRS